MRRYSADMAKRSTLPALLAFTVAACVLLGALASSTANAQSQHNGRTGKTRSILIDSDMRENAKRNVEQYEWARDRRDNLLRAVKPYVEMPAEELWALLPSQEMPRARRPYSPHSQTSPHSMGCPQCYLDHGGERDLIWNGRIDLLGRPWQVQCGHCNTWFPKNDFERYYKSALDETGRFRLGGGEPQFLEPREGVEGEARQWIDDGAGFEYDGYKWFFAAVYADALWRELAQVCNRLATLYTLTEEPEYARRAAIILDRMADLYPEMDERVGRALGTFTSYGPGRIMGRGWEYGAIRRPVAKAYDYVYDAIRNDEELVEFLARMSEAHEGPDKRSFDAIDRHLRENLLIDFVEDIIEHREDLDRGRAHTPLAVAAAALDDPVRTPRYLDWLFKEDGGRVPYTLGEHLQRDGFNVNSGLGYMSTTGRVMYGVAELLDRLDAADVDLYADFPMLMNSFTMLSRVRVLDKVHPAVGDGGSSMSVGMTRYPMDMLLAGYRRFESRAIAREIMHNNPSGWEEEILQESIYSEDPETLVQSIKAHLPEQPEPHESYNSGGTGLAVLQAPWRENERAAAIWYSRTLWTSHAHADRLTLHLWAFDEVLMPDMGYPEHTGGWPKRHGFTRHTISHNTLMINDTRQNRGYAGKTRLFADAGPFRVADIDGLGPASVLYEDARTYRRAAVMVDVDDTNSYVLDLFWARGGHSHRLIQNGGGPEATHHGLELIEQEGGTYAGEDVAFGAEYDGELRAGYSGTGFQFLKNVARDVEPPESFWLDWEIDNSRHADEPDWRAHMRVHNLTQVDEVALAHGEPPRGRPDRVRYSLRSRLGEDLSTQFITIIEPYMHEPFIERVEVLKRIEREDEPFAAAVEVTLVDGRRDVILSRKEPGILDVDGVRLEGRFGLVRFDANGDVEMMAAIAADEIRAGDLSLTSEPGVYSGALAEFDDSDPHNVLLELTAAIGEDAAGQYIIIDNKEIADGSYRIESVEDEYTVNIGMSPLYERLVDVNDFAAGAVGNIEAGELYIIPRTAVWMREQ